MKGRIKNEKDRVFYGQLRDEWLRLATVPADLFSDRWAFKRVSFNSGRRSDSVYKNKISQNKNKVKKEEV